MEQFTELEVWKRACRLSVELYRVLADCRDWGFKDQITRAGLSVPSNIAEGYERGSRADYLRFLHFAKGSCSELRTQLFIGAKVGFLAHDESEALVTESEEISRMLQGMINSLKKLQHN